MGERIIKMTLSEQIYNILKEDILAGKISLGDKLINRDLQERFQVSSTPVRDAINKLYQDGLVQEVTKTGAQLIGFDGVYMRELNDFITILCCNALTLSAEVKPQLVTEGLYRCQEQMKQAADNTEYFEADFRFHKTFFDYCGNRFLKETYKQYNLIRTLLMRYAIRTQENRDISTQQHHAITEAYAIKEYARARRLLEEHYRYGVKLALERS